MMNWLTNWWSGDKKPAPKKIYCRESLFCPASFEIADRQFEEILKNLKLEKISEIEQVYLQLEICKRLASHYEKEKARLSSEALQEKLKSDGK